MQASEAQIEATERALLAWCREDNKHIAPDGRVDPATAARLLDVEVLTLQNWRSAGDGPIYYRGVGAARITYRIRDLADWIENRRVDPSKRTF